MHHGAQKSTMTGFSDLRTSLSNVASVTSATAISSKPPSLKRLPFDPLILACQWVLLRLGGATNRCPRALSPALFEAAGERSEEHTSELQSRQYLVCRLLLEKKNSTPTQASRR